MNARALNPEMRQTPNQHAAIDLAKFICALLVIIIHTSPLESISDTAHFFVNHILARVAVPLFFRFQDFFSLGS